MTSQVKAHELTTSRWYFKAAMIIKPHIPRSLLGKSEAQVLKIYGFDIKYIERSDAYCIYHDRINSVPDTIIDPEQLYRQLVMDYPGEDGSYNPDWVDTLKAMLNRQKDEEITRHDIEDVLGDFDPIFQSILTKPRNVGDDRLKEIVIEESYQVGPHGFPDDTGFEIHRITPAAIQRISSKDITAMMRNGMDICRPLVAV